MFKRTANVGFIDAAGLSCTAALPTSDVRICAETRRKQTVTGDDDKHTEPNKSILNRSHCFLFSSQGVTEHVTLTTTSKNEAIFVPLVASGFVKCQCFRLSCQKRSVKQIAAYLRNLTSDHLQVGLYLASDQLIEPLFQLAHNSNCSRATTRTTQNKKQRR